MHEAARGGVGQRERLGEDLLHPRIGREGLALDDADGGQGPHEFRVERRGRLLLHDLVEHFVEAEVVGRNRCCNALPLPSWNTVGGGGRDSAEPGLAAQELGDARAETAGFVGINLGRLPDQLDRGLRIVLLQKQRARAHTTRVVRDAGDEEPALWQRTVVARRQDQVFPAFAPIGTGQAEIRDPAKPDNRRTHREPWAAPRAPWAPW